MVSDRLKVRKPFMLLGGVCAVAMGLVFASLATHPHTSYGTFVIVIMVMSASRGIAYAPWMAAYTETLESRNPALVATGLAIWGWILRLVAAASFLIVPFIVPSATPVADYGPQAAALQTRYGTQIATLKLVDPVTLAQLQADSTNRRTIVAAAEQISRGHTCRQWWRSPPCNPPPRSRRPTGSSCRPTAGRCWRKSRPMTT